MFRRDESRGTALPYPCIDEVESLLRETHSFLFAPVTNALTRARPSAKGADHGFSDTL
jgi:hypothetical protein